MSTITTSDGTEIFYEDWGTGQPIVFSHGWPLSSDDWDNQTLFFLAQGYRVIAHDRRWRSGPLPRPPRREPSVERRASPSAVPALMVQTDATRKDLPKSVFDDLQAQLAANRSEF